MTTIDKRAVLEQLRADVARALEVMVQAAESARDAATHEESKPENDKDTRGLEAGYLAGAQAARAAELKSTLQQLSELEPRAFGPEDPIRALALVELVDTDTDATLRVFLSPVGGGLKVKVQGALVQVVTPRSPLGDALMGKRAGDLVEVTAGPRTRELEVTAVF